jgi:hypothetical protein
MVNTGYNEGADAIAQGAAQALGVSPTIGGLAGKVAGNTLHRPEMMKDAIAQAKTGNVTGGTAVAIMCEWHNCHALACLVAHAPEVSAWLLKQ